MKLSVSSRLSQASHDHRSFTVHRLLRRILFRYGWDTRGRNIAAARLLSSVFFDLGEDERALLDVGSGEQGVSPFLKNVLVTAVDRKSTQASNGIDLHADITALPFANHSFPVVSCIDVLEHLSGPQRQAAVCELVRVARRALVVTFPSGSAARASDQAMLQASQERGSRGPDWVLEHLKEPLPKSDEISNWVRSVASGSGREPRIGLYYNEPVAICRFVRAVAVRSVPLYVLVNVLLGILSGFIPNPACHNSYRVILLVTFE